MNNVDGLTVSKCFQYVGEFGAEIESLCDTLNTLLADSLKNGKESFVLNGGAESSGRNHESEWVTTDYSFSFPLKSSSKGKKKTERYVGYQISITGDGTAIPGKSDPEPLLHVFLWDCPVDFDDTYIGFPCGEDDDFSVQVDRLMFWQEEDSREWNKCEWTYSLRLVMLNSPDDLKKYVVEPVMALLQEKEVTSALPDEWFENILIRYPDAKQLTGKS